MTVTETVLNDLADFVGGQVGAGRKPGGTRFVVLAASGILTWSWDDDRIIEHVLADTVQFALTTNGMTYTQINALGAPVDIGAAQILVYASGNVQEGLYVNRLVKAGTLLTLSNSSSQVNKISVRWSLT